MTDQLPEFIEVNGTKRATHNSEGRPIHPDPEAIHAFWEWFRNSKAVDKKGRPLVLYHGTGSLENCDVFKPEMTGFGNDQFGSGFYFTTNRVEASGYSTDVTPNVAEGVRKLGGDDSPGVLPVYLAVERPVIVEGHSLRDSDLNLSVTQAYAIIARCPGIRDLDNSPLGDFVDIWSAGEVTDQMLRKVAQNYAGRRALQLENDFFRDQAAAFREALRDVTKYDGATFYYNDGANGEVNCHFVAWFPEQIKSALGNSGRFLADVPDITDYVVPEPAVVLRPRMR